MGAPPLQSRDSLAPVAAEVQCIIHAQREDWP